MKETNLMRAESARISGAMQAPCHAIEYMCYQTQRSEIVYRLHLRVSCDR
jgi:hypothetical protein